MTRDPKRQKTGRTATSRKRLAPFMSERQLEAYLISRDALRRVQRTSELFVAASQPPSTGAAFGTSGSLH
jgi:hypothetical protein